MAEAKRINPRNFPCDKCEMSYTTNQKLKFHKMSVHDGIKLNCPHCDVKLANPDTLQKHIKKQHEGMFLNDPKANSSQADQASPFYLKAFKAPNHRKL